MTWSDFLSFISMVLYSYTLVVLRNTLVWLTFKTRKITGVIDLFNNSTFINFYEKSERVYKKNYCKYNIHLLLNVMLFFPQLSRLLWNMYDYYVRGSGDTGTSLWSGFLAYVPTWAYFVPWLKLICNYNDFGKFINKWNK